MYIGRNVWVCMGRSMVYAVQAPSCAYAHMAGVSFLDFAVETATVFMKVKNWPIVPMEVETTEENKNACWPVTHVAISN